MGTDEQMRMPTTPIILAGVAIAGIVFAFVFGLEAIGSPRTSELLQEAAQAVAMIGGALLLWQKTHQVKQDTTALRNGELRTAMREAVRSEVRAAVEDALVEHKLITERRHPRPAPPSPPPST